MINQLGFLLRFAGNGARHLPVKLPLAVTTFSGLQRR